MSEIDDTAAWQRLVAADPAGPDPDLGALGDRIVAAARADAGAETVAANVPTTPPRTQRMFALAAGVAVLAGVGIGGYALGARSSTDIVAGDAPAAAELSVAAGDASTADVGTRAVPTSAAGNADDQTSADEQASGDEQAGASAPSAAAAPFSLAEGDAAATLAPTTAPMPKVPQTLAGFSLSDAGIDRAALATQLARMLGVKGKPLALPSGDWIVGPAEGTNAVLVVGSSSAVPWSMTNPAPPVPAGSEISESRANEVARTLFAQIGVPVDEVEWEAVSVGGLITETAWYVTDGERTPLFWRIVFDTTGEIVSAAGFAGNVTPADAE